MWRTNEPQSLQGTHTDMVISHAPKEVNVTLWHDMWPEISVLLFLLAWAAVIAGFMLTPQ